MALFGDTRVYTRNVASARSLPPIAVQPYRPHLIDVFSVAVRDYRWTAELAVVALMRGTRAGRVLAAAAGVDIALTAYRYTRKQFVVSDDGSSLRDSAEIRILELNVHGGMGGSGQYFANRCKLDRLAAAIAEHQPHIVLLQELDRCALRSNGVDTLAALSRRLRPTSAIMAPACEKIYGRCEGTGVMTFAGYTIVDARGIRIDDPVGEGTLRRARSAWAGWLDVIGGRWRLRQRLLPGVTEYQPRGATDAMVRTPAGRLIRVMSVHLSSPHDGIDESARQVAPLVATIASFTGPTIFGGDFNTRNGSPELAREHRWCMQAGLQEASAGQRSNSDRIYVSRHWDLVSASTIDPGDRPAVSDHAPVLVTVNLAAETELIQGSSTRKTGTVTMQL